MLSWTSWLSWWPFKPQTRVQSPPRVPNSNNWNCQNIEALILHSLLRGTTTIITITNKLFLGQPRGQVHVSRAVTETDEGASRTLDQKDCSKYMPPQLSWQSIWLLTRESQVRVLKEAPIWRISSEEQNASLSRWRSRVQVPYASPPPFFPI